MPHKITVRTNGQTLTVNASISHWTSEALALAASGTNDVESTTTTTITSDYDLWFANTATEATITVKQLDGTQLLAQTFPVTPGHPNRTLSPAPTVLQLAGDVSARQAIAAEGVASGFSTMPRYACNAAPTMTSQVLRGAGFYAPSNITVGSIKVITSSTAAAATPSLVRMGLYTIDSAGDATLVASTANDTALLAATNTGYTKALSDSYALTAGARYMVTLLVVTAATAPTVCGATLGGQEVGSQLPRLTMSKAAQADLPATLAESAMTDSTSAVYFELIPA